MSTEIDVLVLNYLAFCDRKNEHLRQRNEFRVYVPIM